MPRRFYPFDTMDNEETKIVMLGLGVIVGNLYRKATEHGRDEIKRNMIKLIQSLAVIEKIEIGDDDDIIESLEELGFKNIQK